MDNLEGEIAKICKNMQNVILTPTFAAAISRKNTSKSIELRQEGNQLFTTMAHDKETHSRILSLYTQSAALAESGSEELALAYGNRSALLIHLKRYEECLVDIQMATQITKSEQLKAKLEVRRVHCLAMGKGSKREKSSGQRRKIPLEARMKASKNIPCASESIAISFNEKYGRHIIAAQDIEPGTVIAVEKAFAFGVKKSCMYLNCTHCLNMAWNGIPCDSCTAAVFCSENCKKEALLQYHDVECSLFPILYQISSSNIILAVRMLIVTIRKEGWAHIIKQDRELENDKNMYWNRFFNHNIFQSRTFYSMYNLLGNEKHTNLEESLLSSIVEFLFENTNLHENIPNIDSPAVRKNIILSAKTILLKIYLIVKRNSFSFDYSYWCYYSSKESKVAEGLMKVGCMIASFCSFFNHSCCNNVERLFTCNQEILLYTRTSVKKGQQLFINYGTNILSQKVSQRLLFLKETYDIVCDCQACKEDWQMDTMRQSHKHYNKELEIKLFSNFALAGLQYSTLNVISDGSYKNVVISEKSLKDFIKITKIVEKHCTGIEAYANTVRTYCYFHSFFGKLYGIQNEIPNTCQI